MTATAPRRYPRAKEASAASRPLVIRVRGTSYGTAPSGLGVSSGPRRSSDVKSRLLSSADPGPPSIVDRVAAPIPDRVTVAMARAEAAGFPLSCEPAVGQLLAVLAAYLPASGHVLELGAGAGVGTAWVVTGVSDRRDVTLVSVEPDNPAHRLYKRHGFQVTGTVDGSLTMLLPR